MQASCQVHIANCDLHMAAAMGRGDNMRHGWGAQAAQCRQITALEQARKAQKGLFAHQPEDVVPFTFFELMESSAKHVGKMNEAI